ncbi:MAG: hypothetical protein EXX96DRAFT_613420 [Benjaminiella poitrasii]|nr:MAG: hypothetical protein EXX96DRAFT_613420 [Benjaminiella poitrasii]
MKYINFEVIITLDKRLHKSELIELVFRPGYYLSLVKVFSNTTTSLYTLEQDFHMRPTSAFFIHTIPISMPNKFEQYKSKIPVFVFDGGMFGKDLVHLKGLRCGVTGMFYQPLKKRERAGD